MFWRKDSHKIGRGAKVARDVEIGHWGNVGAYSRVGKGVTLGPWSEIGKHTSIGDGCNFGDWACVGNEVTMGAGVTLGSHTIIQDGAIIADGATLGDFDLVTRDGIIPNRSSGFCLTCVGSDFKVSTQAGWTATFPRQLTYDNQDTAMDLVRDYMRGISEQLAKYVSEPEPAVDELSL